MVISRGEFHEIGESKLKKYDKWIAENPERLSRDQLKEAVEWWKNEIKEDYNRLEQVPKNYDATYLAGFNNITLTSMLFGIIEGYYIRKLEKELDKKIG